MNKHRLLRPLLCSVGQILDAMEKGGIAKTEANVARAVSWVEGSAQLAVDIALEELATGGRTYNHSAPPSARYFNVFEIDGPWEG